MFPYDPNFQSYVIMAAKRAPLLDYPAKLLLPYCQHLNMETSSLPFAEVGPVVMAENVHPQFHAYTLFLIAVIVIKFHGKLQHSFR